MREYWASGGSRARAWRARQSVRRASRMVSLSMDLYVISLATGATGLAAMAMLGLSHAGHGGPGGHGGDDNGHVGHGSHGGDDNGQRAGDIGPRGEAPPPAPISRPAGPGGARLL